MSKRRRRTRSPVDFIPTPDPLLRDPCLAHVIDIPVLGLVSRFETNSRYVHDMVVETFGSWQCLPEEQRVYEQDALRVRIVVHEGDEGNSEHARIRYICPDPWREVLHSPGSLAISDPLRRESIAYVTTALASDREHFRYMVLEGMTLGLLSHFDRHPIHAAAIGKSGRAVLLAAPSGTGKSTLAYAAHAAGLDVLADDNVWVQLTPALRVWGWPGRVLLMREVASSLPHGATLGSAWRDNGKQKLACHLDASGQVSRHFADTAEVCILERGSTGPALERVTPASLIGELTSQLTSGFDLFAEEHGTVIRALTVNGGWRLRLSEDPGEAVPLIHKMLDGE